MPRSDQPDIRERLLIGAADVLVADGIEGLTVRRVAEAAGRSTMCVYTKFGSRRGLMHEVFAQAETSLAAAMEKARPVDGDAALGLAAAYRRFAKRNPAAYALLFEHPLPTLDIDESLRRDAIARIVTLIGQSSAGFDEQSAVAIWALMHGLIAAERTQPAPPGGWESYYLTSIGNANGSGVRA
ncbi:TetR/AcrR family transcriptional regulator [Kribbella sp. NBC_01245]|uniref:TetR/AcrR family transcriptional regulator n=1 Tax=Kribbella sp. NBC_01245 TaxID=2903578 RepID=UPI002E2C141A|nr:TetR/AcrR family transcriptional regulator [Kribbella sp. NBC_01245]